MRKVNIYTQSAFKGIRQTSGSIIYILEFKTKKGSATLTKMRYFPHTTPNEAELRNIIEALRRMNEKCELTIYTDSAFVAAGYNSGWIDNWKKNNWKTSKGEEVTHVKLWQELDRLLMGHKFNFVVGMAHEYRNWMKDEVNKNAKENEDV